jgi:hypothetical protein
VVALFLVVFALLLMAVRLFPAVFVALVPELEFPEPVLFH